MRLALALLVCCLVFNNKVAKSAEINATPVPGLADTAMITLSGVMVDLDKEQFRAAVATYPKAIVAFQSPGGSLIAGIEIGTQIRLRNYMTLVPSGVQCASACALAWSAAQNAQRGRGPASDFTLLRLMRTGRRSKRGPETLFLELI